MKQIFAWLFAAIFFAAGCAQSPDLAEPVRGGGYENADGLVIVAACPPATRTDIEEGKSTWEAGDRITVVYDGAAYEYTAAEAGPTTAFTSEAGIADYDASKPLTAYYPATTAEGVVAVEAERTIALDAESQSNPARVPLVGLPTSGNLAEGALEVTFRNIFSVIELRIDAGELASAAQSLTVEPADEAAFEGFLSFEGTVDPETLALTPAENGTGNSLIFNFAEGVDLTKPQTIKFPVGRFRSEAGLRLTLNTADGKSYSKNIYKTGITSYAEQGGVFRAKHMAKALYAFAPQGGIICLVNDDGNAFVGCENYGLVITDRANYKGTLFGQCNKAARFSDCIAQGDLGAYEDGSYALVGVNYTNYMSYIGDHNATAVHVNSQNILYYPNGSQVPAEPEFGVNLSSVELNAQGSNAAVVQLSSVDYDWTVSADGDWAHITDLSDVPVVSGVKDPGVQYIKIGADANTKTAPRSAVVTFASTDGSKSATVRVDQQARGEAFPSKWVFQASTLPLYGSSWTDDNVIPATSGAAGFISVVRGDANASAAFKRSVVTNRPAVSTMVEGDYWLYTFPVENLAAGSVVDFNATMAGEANSPKYFIVEYLDGGVWKSVEADLLTAPENPAVRYTYKCSGTATGSSYQHATVMQTMRFENAVTDGEVKIRCRAVGPYTCAGGTQNITATNAASSIPPYGFTGSYVQNFGTATPRDTKKVLCLGNSFSYYSNPAWMLKEIAWREGHALNIKAHFKGSQTLTQHLSLGFSTDVIEQGGYDFAFLQDQSQNPANYGRDATASILTGLTTLADKVRAASPSCKVILEETWTFSSASYGGFTDFPTFETYNDAGAKAMAKAAGTWVSPIGPAFRQVREGGSGINLYYSDSKHQSEYGAYLKACVNYLVLFGERFGADPADCGLNPDKAAYLRSVAEQIVLGNEGDYFIER